MIPQPFIMNPGLGDIHAILIQKADLPCYSILQHNSSSKKTLDSCPRCRVLPVTTAKTPSSAPCYCDDGHGDYNRSYDEGYDDFDYADYSTGKEDNNFRTQQKKKRKTEKQIIEDILNRWD